ncbi:MAG TPA: adenosylmethionine--8-amino-7-oxononanoate transaminase [Lacipirellulaceae bacterium]|nr:adenosylmethionine--8-amino-7-oxononanoate transaminase [Lacipirellulaceae bacterium]
MFGSPIHADLYDWDRGHYWHAFTQMAEYEPLVITRAEGCRLFDIDGREYLDGASSMWCNVHGHNHPRINAAIRDQLDRVAHCTALGMGCDTTVRLAKRLADLAPGNLEHVFFASDGSSAIEVAIKMAYQYWQQCELPRPQKTKFLAFGEAYHGDTIGSASVSGIDRFHALFKPLLFDVIRAPLPDSRRLPLPLREGRVEGAWPIAPIAPSSPPELVSAMTYFLSQVEVLLRQFHEELAAVVIEPLVQCAAGMIMHPPGFLRGLRELTQSYRVLLIADEIAVGFGRTGKLFACEHENVVPDFLCLGKGLSGGYLPIAATITHDQIYRAFLGKFDEGRALHHGHTFSGNPLASAAALASLDVFNDEQTLEKLRAKSERLGEHLCTLAEHPHVCSTRQRGFIGALELTPNKTTGEPYPAHQRRAWRVCRETLAKGVWLRPLADILYVMPPLSITLDELDCIMTILASAIDTVTRDSG